MRISQDDLNARARRLRLVLLDVDGVLTDGTVTIDSAGGEAKAFFIRDGSAIVFSRREGLEVGILSGRPSAATTRRAAELGIRVVSQGGPNKRLGYADILASHGYTDVDVAYMGDDVLDLPVITRVGLSASPADATVEVRERVDWVSQYPGGRGAVREFLEVIHRARGSWETFVREHLA